MACLLGGAEVALAKHFNQSQPFAERRDDSGIVAFWMTAFAVLNSIGTSRLRIHICHTDGSLGVVFVRALSCAIYCSKRLFVCRLERGHGAARILPGSRLSAFSR